MDIRCRRHSGKDMTESRQFTAAMDALIDVWKRLADPSKFGQLLLNHSLFRQGQVQPICVHLCSSAVPFGHLEPVIDPPRQNSTGSLIVRNVK
jgi:putative heme degradation protein